MYIQCVGLTVDEAHCCIILRTIEILIIIIIIIITNMCKNLNLMKLKPGLVALHGNDPGRKHNTGAQYGPHGAPADPKGQYDTPPGCPLLHKKEVLQVFQ